MISRLGLPGLFGITMGLGLGLLAQSGTKAQAFYPEQVQCYPSPVAQAKKTVAVQSLTPADAAQILTAITPAAQAALAAAEHCAANSCPSAARATLDAKLKLYLAQRRSITTDLYHRQGPHGLTAATEIFTQGSGPALTAKLSSLYEAGKLDVAKFADDKEALALVLTKPASAFRPCEALQRHSRIYGYVY